MKIFNKKSNKGFSIAEVVISVFVITVGMLAILKLITSSMTYSMVSRDQVIASQLAQEGIELVRNVRDNNVFNEEAWNLGLGNNSDACAEYDMDTQDPDFTCLTNQLFYDPVTYIYSHDSGGEATRFKRQIVLNEINNYGDATIDEVKVTSSVWWGEDALAPSPCNSAKKCVQIEDSLLPYE